MGKTNRSDKLKEQRLYEENMNSKNQLMKIVAYNNAKDIVVEFQDNHKEKVHTTYDNFKKGCITNPCDKFKLGETRLNNQGCLMTIVEGNKSCDIVVEFQDEHKAKVHTQYSNYKSGNVKNPYAKTVHGVGMIGEKYPSQINYHHTKEYAAWRNVLKRSFDKQFKKEHPTYNDVICCDDWLLFDNFYEWLHMQKNFDKWFENPSWSIDKDILIKGNKVYSPDACCLVPQNVNALFTKRDHDRGELPIGVTKNKYGKFVAQCENQFSKERSYIGTFDTVEEAFLEYKIKKEYIIRKVADIEFKNGNITRNCYKAMLEYNVDIND